MYRFDSDVDNDTDSDDTAAHSTATTAAMQQPSTSVSQPASDTHCRQTKTNKLSLIKNRRTVSIRSSAGDK